MQNQIKMKRFVIILYLLLICPVFAQETDEWSEVDRGVTQLNQIKFSYTRKISIPINPHDESGEKFELFYFYEKFDADKPSILVCDGGPGSFLLDPKEAPLATFDDINIIYFHVRGAGLSQLPPSSKYDRFLRMRYVANDMEAIRKSLKIERWFAVFGSSAGTVMAQLYAHHYPQQVRKIVLESPPSRHVVEPDSSDFIKLMQNSLRRIFAIDAYQYFQHLTAEQIDTIIEQFGSICDEIKEEFIEIDFLIKAMVNEELGVEEYAKILQYSTAYYMSLLYLAYIGWAPTGESVVYMQNAVALIIAYESQPHLFQQDQLVAEYANIVEGLEKLAEEEFSEDRQMGDHNRSRRVLMVMQFHDGLARSALLDAEAAFEKFGLLDTESFEEGDKLVPWDPKDWQHSVATLILQGAADGAVTVDMASHYFDNGLSGQRALFVFEGVGHSFDGFANRLPERIIRDFLSSNSALALVPWASVEGITLRVK